MGWQRAEFESLAVMHLPPPNSRHAPRKKDKPTDIDKLHRAMSKAAAELQKEVEAMGKKHRYYTKKKHKADDAVEQLRRLELLLAVGGGEGGGGSS